MRLESFRVRGFGPFKKEWSVDVSEMRGLVAVTGVNGAGKSTFLELGLPGALYRQTPTRGSLVDLAVARDACLDVTVVNGARWTLRHLVDGQSGKSEALVLDADGQPALPDTKVKSYDAWAAKHWPAPEVLFSTIFGAQGSGGFLAAKPAERKAILLRVLGVELLEALAADARERTKAARGRVETAAARLADERARARDVAAFELSLERAKREVNEADAALALAKAAVETAHAESALLAQLHQENAELGRRYGALTETRAAAATKLKDTSERLSNNRGVLAEGEAIRAAVAKLAALTDELAQAEAAASVAEAAAREALAPWSDVNERKRAAQLRGDRARARLKDQAMIEAAQLELPNLRDAEEEADRDVSRLVAEIEALNATHLAGADERIGALRGGLDSIREAVDANASSDPDDLAGIAIEALETDDASVAQATSLPGLRKELQGRLAAARDRLALAQRQLGDAERLAARAGDLAGAEGEREEADRELLALSEGYAAAGEDGKAKHAAATELRAKVNQLLAEREALKPVAARAARLEQATARVDELTPIEASLQTEVAKLDLELGGLPSPHVLPPSPDLAALRSAVLVAEQICSGNARILAGFEQRLEQARASAARQAELEAEEQQHMVELGDWARVAADLGKDGLQALEIDAAGPELTNLTNAILHRAHGPRFTVRVETQRASADGKRQLEGCDVMVLDTVQGREAAGETFSGGERVVIAEALSLAILVLSCRRNGLTDVTLVRDESGAALDPGNARVYVEMLRHAIELTGARHCLLVSHVPEVQELCDHRIEVGAPQQTEARAA